MKTDRGKEDMQKIDLKIPRLCTRCKDCREKLGDLSDYRGRVLQRAGIDVTKQLIDPLIVTGGGCHASSALTYLSKVLLKYPVEPTGNHKNSSVPTSTGVTREDDQWHPSQLAPPGNMSICRKLYNPRHNFAPRDNIITCQGTFTKQCNMT